MDDRYTRRTVVGAGLSTLGVLAVGRYGWGQYQSRSHLRIRPLEVRSRTAEPVTIELTLTDDAGHRTETETEQLARADTETQLSGPWMKYAGEWRLNATLETDSLELTAGTIRGRLEDAGWGASCVRLSIVITANSRLESQIEPSQRC